MVATNHQLACTPFTVTTVEATTKNKFATTKQKVSLTEMQVVFSDVEGKYPVGSSVYVTSDQFTAAWATRVYELDGKKFVLVPFAAIQLSSVDPARNLPGWTLGTTS